MLQQQFTATTKSGRKVTLTAENTTKSIATNYQVKQLDNVRFAVVIPAAQSLEAIGAALPANMKEALVLLDDATGWKAFENACRKERYEAELAANPLQAQRADLVAALDRAIDNGGEDAFPGSKASVQYHTAWNALRAFNTAAD